MKGLRPRITAVITVYNGETHIAKAVQSLLGQTEKRIEVLVLNDGSTDGTLKVLRRFRDRRLRVLDLPRMGRAAALERAGLEARGRYIANLDADDVSFPERLKEQAAFLDSNPHVAWVGSGEEQADSRRAERHRRVYPCADEEIRLQSAKCIPYCHSSIMFRRSLIEAGINYDPRQPYLIDFEFFLRVAERHRVANLPRVLVKRHLRGESYFQKNFSTFRQNTRLAAYCFSAIRRFRLPVQCYLFPVARLFYPFLPTGLKRWVRGQQGLKETHG